MTYEGVVKSWFSERGFGFILRIPSGENLFAHISHVENRCELQRGDIVTFEISDTGRRNGAPQAVNIVLVKRLADVKAVDYVR